MIGNIILIGYKGIRYIQGKTKLTLIFGAGTYDTFRYCYIGTYLHYTVSTSERKYEWRSHFLIEGIYPFQNSFVWP